MRKTTALGLLPARAQPTHLIFAAKSVCLVLRNLMDFPQDQVFKHENKQLVWAAVKSKVSVLLEGENLSCVWVQTENAKIFFEEIC